MKRMMAATLVLAVFMAGYLAGNRQVPLSLAVDAQSDCQTFTETGKKVCGDFLTYWKANGGLAQQGFPVSETFDEKSETDGKTYTVQYFERAVFEMHPELPAGKQVLLTLLGAQKFKARYNGTPVSAASVSATGTSTVVVAPTGTTVAATATIAPTAKPTAAPTVASVASGPPAGDDEAFKAYLKQKYASVGSHKIDLQALSIDRAGSGSNASVIVSFTVTLRDGVDYFNSNAPRADLQAWGTALLVDLKAKYPNTYVTGTLASTFYADSYDRSTDCTYTSDSYTSGQGWYSALYYVKVYYIPGSSGDKVRACFGA